MRRLVTFLIISALSQGYSLLAQNCAAPNCWIGNFYQYNILAQNGQAVDVGTLSGFGRGPSINEFGEVAFVGQVSNSSGQALGDTIFFGSANASTLTTVAPTFLNPSRTFDDAVQINDSLQIVTNDRFAGAPPHYYIRVWNGSQPGSFTLAAQSGSQFQSVLTDPAIDSSNDVVFSALNSSFNPLLVQSSPPYTKYAQVAESTPLRPLISDAGSTIVRAGNTDTSPIVLYSSALQTPLTIADTSQFSKLGQSPGLSRDGEVVAFAGDLTAGGTQGSDAWDAYPGPGIFAAVIQNGAILYRMRVAGFHYQNQDGMKQIEATNVNGKLYPDEGTPFCDPVAQCVPGGELEDLPPFSGPIPVYFQTFTESGFQASTEWENRIGVTHWSFGGNGGNTIVVSFIATPNASDAAGLNLFTLNQGLWTVRADWFVTQNYPFFTHTYRPTPVVQVGDTLGKTGSSVASIAVYDPLANMAPEQANGNHRLAYWVSTSNNGQMILSASYIQQFGGSIGRNAGSSCCNESGTAGALVTSNGMNLILSNDHVLANPVSTTNNGAAPGDPISAPGLSDFACQSPHEVATFFSAPTLSTGIDAALGLLETDEINTTGQIYNIGIPASSTIKPAVGMQVAKQGSATGLTCGTVKSASLTITPPIPYHPCGSKEFKVQFKNQVIVETGNINYPFLLSGDSGSIIVKASTAQPLALLFAGGTDTTTGQQAAVANPISSVVSALKISFVGGSTHPISGCHFKEKETLLPNGEEERAARVKEKYEPQLLRIPDVFGVGIGASPDNPIKAAIVVLVSSGVSYERIPRSIEGIPVNALLFEDIEPKVACK
jgi:hypothetical protein